MLGHLHKPPGTEKMGQRRMLVTVTVAGSTGPIRFVTSEEELVGGVIGTTLRCYSRHGRFPLLGSDISEFHLFDQSDFMGPLDPSQPIGPNSSRSLLLCKKQQWQELLSVMGTTTTMVTSQPQPHKTVQKKGTSSSYHGRSSGSSVGGVWKSFLHKSLHIH